MGLNHMNGRVEDAVTGRFLSPDPTVNAPANTQDYNRYSYVNNNPLSFADPTGFDEVSAAVHQDDGQSVDTGNADNDFPEIVVEGTASNSTFMSFNPGEYTAKAPNGDLTVFAVASHASTATTTAPTQRGLPSIALLPTQTPAPAQSQFPALKPNYFTGDLPSERGLQGIDDFVTQLIGNLFSPQPTYINGVQANTGMAPALFAAGGVVAGEYSLCSATGGFKGLATNLSADEFSANLQANGFTATQIMGTNGSVTVLDNGQGSIYTVYTRSSTEVSGAQYIGPNFSINGLVKYNLNVPGLTVPGP